MSDLTVPGEPARAPAISTIAFGLTGSAVSVALPGIVAGLVQSQRILPSGADLIVALEMSGAALATAVVSPFVSRIDRRFVAVLAAFVALLCDVLATRMNSLEGFAAVRLLAGFSEGSVLALTVAFFATTQRPGRNIGLFVAANLTVATIILRLLPAAIGEFGDRGAFWILAGLAAAALAASLTFPSGAARKQGKDAPAAGARQVTSTLVVALGLVGNILFFTAIGSIWPLMIRIAAAIGISLVSASAVLSTATFAGIAGALFAAWLESRTPPRLILIGGSVVILGSMVGIAASGGFAGFAVAAVLFMASWVFLSPTYVSILAVADPQGRAAAFSMTTQYGGLALGPALAALVNSEGHYRGSIVAGFVLATVAAACMIYADLKSRQRVSSGTPQACPTVINTGMSSSD